MESRRFGPPLQRIDLYAINCWLLVSLSRRLRLRSNTNPGLGASVVTLFLLSALDMPRARRGSLFAVMARIVEGVRCLEYILEAWETSGTEQVGSIFSMRCSHSVEEADRPV